MNSDKTKNSSIAEILLSLIAVFVISLFLDRCKDNSYKESINRYKGETIGYTTCFVKSGKTSSLKYFYYINGEKIINKDYSYATRSNSFLKKFYLVKYDINNPNECQIVLEDTINPDTNAVMNLGFKKKKIYYYDHITSTYKEKTEWE